MTLKNKISNKQLSNILIFLIFFSIVCTFSLNYYEKKSVDRSKLPSKVEESTGFQRWLTNLKNKDFEIEADEFRLVEDNEIFNVSWTKVFSIEDETALNDFTTRFAETEDQKKVVYSPNDVQFVDYRILDRYGYKVNEVYLFGKRDSKIYDTKLVDCSINANCYFDRAFFLEDSNDTVVISEVSRTIDKKSQDSPICTVDDLCEYSFKLHVVDLLRNKRYVYESKPFMGVMADFKPEL